MDLRGQARQLRQDEGLSARQIGERLGVPQRTVANWLAGLPVPEWTQRPNAKDELRARAVALRADGMSVPDIAHELGVSGSTAWLWVREQPLDRDGARAKAGVDRRTAAVRASWTRRLAETDRQRQAAHEAAAEQVRDATDTDLLKIGAIMYWCEGTKAKPWSGFSGEHIEFTNSDPGLVLVFLAFLRMMGVARANIGFRLAIHETADEVVARGWWADLIGASPEEFKRSKIKRALPKTNRRNTGSNYRGCLVISVRRSRQLYWAVEGVVSELARQAGVQWAAQHDPPQLAKLAEPSAVV